MVTNQNSFTRYQIVFRYFCRPDRFKADYIQKRSLYFIRNRVCGQSFIELK